jgi:hypothetical protein
MRFCCAMVLVAGLGLAAGCSDPASSQPGAPGQAKTPKVSSFTGKLVAEGKPVSFAPGETVLLRVTHEAEANENGIPIKADGTFSIGAMPSGKYQAMLERSGTPGAKEKRGSKILYEVPDGFTIVAGSTETVIELGPGFNKK